MATIFIDDRQYEVPDGNNLLHTIISLGIDLPYFCWHPALGSVGACRQCAVVQYKDKDDDRGKLVMACMVPVTDGLRCSVRATEAVQFRESVIEWLMVNHPHDCPVCDEGGECHLQDMTVMAGHNYRRFKFNKRTFRNQDLGPFIYHEMNRCITCYRCVRFYHDYAGGDDLQATGAHDHVYFGRFEDGPLESEFSGNLVEVCPTGVFTDKTLRRHYTRKWDLQSGPSVCQHCSLGCNTLAGERYGKLVRILNRYNRQVNGYFICDRGRFGYEFVNSDKRIREVRLKDNPGERKSSPDTSEALRKCMGKGKRVIGIGSPRASLESNMALLTLVGEGNFYHGVTATEHAIVAAIINELQITPDHIASLHDIERADAVLVLGEDLTNTAPMLALAVRQAVRNKPMERAAKLKINRWDDAAVRELAQDEHGPFYQIMVHATKLDRIATAARTMAPQDIARFGLAVAHAIDQKAPAVDGLSDDMRQLAKEAAEALKEAKRPAIIAGGSLNELSVIHAASNCARALYDTVNKGQIAYVMPDCNSMGLGMLGGSHLTEALARIDGGHVDTMVLLENDLYRTVDKRDLDERLDKIETLVCLDQLATRTAERADLVLPAATFADGDGTVVNNEGRAQRYSQALNPDGEVREAWKWLSEAMEHRQIEEAERFRTLDGAVDAVLAHLGRRYDLTEIAPPASFRIHECKVARSPHRYSGRTAMNAHLNVHEPQPPDDGDSALAFSMEGVQENQPGSLIPFFWSPGWNSVQATQHYMKETGAELRGGDPGLRLFASSGNGATGYHSEIPGPFTADSGVFLAVPLYLIFGSEELSSESASIQQRIPEPYAAMNQVMMERTGLKAGDTIELQPEGSTISVVLRWDDSIPNGVVGVVSGHPSLPALSLPSMITLAGGGQT